MKKIFLLMAMMVTCFTMMADDSNLYGGGSGTADDPYQISTLQHLANMSVQSTLITDYSGVYFKMMNDIEVSGPEAWGIGLSNRAFSGTFDGAGYALKGITLLTPVFNYVGTAGVVKNLKIENASTTGVATSNNTALLAGTVQGLVENCQVVNAVQNYSATNMSYFNSGLVAYLTATGKIQNCSYSGTVTTAGGYGSIVGRNMGGAVIDCESTANITIGRGNVTVGGIGGTTQWMNSGSFYNYSGCTFKGEIKVASNNYNGISAGGIAGGGTGATSITKCVNLGKIESIGYTGGIGGNLTNQSLIEDSYNMGLVTDYFMAENLTNVTFAMADYVAGLAGKMDGGTVRRSWNGGTVQSYRSAAGLVGYTGSTGGHLWIDDCYNVGLVNAPYTWTSGNSTVEQSGGLVAYTLGTFNVNIATSLSLGTIINAAVARNENSEYIGWASSADKVLYTNVYYDNQVAGYQSTIGSKTTAELTSGTALEGFDTEKWEFTAGMYPRLKVSAESEAAKLCATPYFLANGNVHGKVMDSFTVSNANNVTWALSENSSAVLEGTNVNVTRGKTVDVVTLTSTLGDSKHESRVTIYPDLFAGSGTQEDPYQIKTYEDLKNLAAATNAGGLDFAGEYLKLMNDIDCESDASFERLSQSTLFSGVFDGDGHSLNNLTMNLQLTSVSNSGLFGVIGKDGVVKNLTIGSTSTIGLGLNCGTIAASVAGTIENCRVLPAKVTTTSARGTFGGIVGTVQATGKVIDCYMASDILLSGSSHNVGGIAAYNYGLIDGCQYANTLAGSSSNYLGGIAAYNYGTIDNCASTGRLFANQYVGGLVGRNMSNAVIKNSLATAVVEYTTNVTVAGAVAGDNNGTFENVVYDKQIAVFDNVVAKGLTGKLTREIVAGGALSSKFAATEGQYPVVAKFAEEPAVVMTALPLIYTDEETRLDMKANVKLQLPSITGLTWKLNDSDDELLYTASTKTAYFGDETTYAVGAMSQTYSGVTRLIQMRCYGNILTGSGTEEDPWIIATEANLRKLSTETAKAYNRGDYAGKHFKVTADITMTSAMTPISTGAQRNFRGVIHGDGHVINNLTINGTTYAGLVGNIGRGGKIENLTIASGEIKGTQYLGAFTGYCNGGSLVNLTNKAAVTGGTQTYVGGIAGYALNATLENLTNNGNVTNKANYTGGVAGYVQGNGAVTYKNLYNTGNVGGGMFTGGVLGTAILCSLDNIENTGNVEGTLTTTNLVGGVIGVVDACQSVNNARNYGTVSNAGVGVGGVIGRYWPQKNTANELTVSNSLNAGKVTGKTSYVGGIVGQVDNVTYKLTVKGCANVDTIQNVAATVAAGTPGAGGIVGGGAPVIEDCYNAGVIMGANCIGGILGRPVNNAAPVTIKNSLNTGWLDGYAANSANIGSITGFNSTAATYSNVAYDKQMSNVAGAGKADVEGIEGKLTAEIATAAVALAPAMNDDATTNAWNKQDGRYPAPAAIAANEAVAATTIPVFLNEVDTRYEVTKDFAVGQAEGAEWTGDEVFFFNVDNVYIKDETVEVGDSKIITGTYNVQVTLGENTRIYPLTLNYEYVATAIDGVTADGEGVALTAGGIVLPAGPYAVFNIAGAKVQAGVAQAGQTVTLPAGTYVVLSRGKGVKVMIK